MILAIKNTCRKIYNKLENKIIIKNQKHLKRYLIFDKLNLLYYYIYIIYIL